jgi:hypothetical protein
MDAEPEAFRQRDRVKRLMIQSLLLVLGAAHEKRTRRNPRKRHRDLHPLAQQDGPPGHSRLDALAEQLHDPRLPGRSLGVLTRLAAGRQQPAVKAQ